jgi:putative flippase GtrA
VFRFALQLLRLVYVRYFVASAAALAVDTGVFLASLRSGMAPAIAAAIGYTAGLIIHWFLSSRAVFTGFLAERGIERRQQQALFLGSALAGLAITVGIVGIGASLGLDPRIGKAAAIAVSFHVTYLLRKKMVFA